MYRRKLSVLGLILFIAGCIASFYLAVVIILTRAEGIFASIRTDSPQNQFNTLRCPLLVGENETFTVTVTISNPTTTKYDLSIEADGFNTLTMDEEVTPHEIIWTWVVTAVEGGKQAIVIQALSHKDLALPGVFHMWPTSFLDSCGIFVIKSPLIGKHTLFLCLMILIIGAILSFPQLYLKIRERNEGDEATEIKSDHDS
jgi:hypothetical protein